jgi:hypothetical protein
LGYSHKPWGQRCPHALSVEVYFWH